MDEIPVPLYVDRRFADHCDKNEMWQAQHLREHDLLERNIELARKELEARLESLNEWKARSIDDRTSFLSRTEYESKHRLLESSIKNESERLLLTSDSKAKESKGDLCVLEERLRTNATWIRNLFIAVGLLLIGVLVDLILQITGVR